MSTKASSRVLITILHLATIGKHSEIAKHGMANGELSTQVSIFKKKSNGFLNKFCGEGIFAVLSGQSANEFDFAWFSGMKYTFCGTRIL